ncbi:nucleotidyltransferase family protein [Marinisporobacter balticus]|uniref:CBS domain protein n=1 Tax=Marinisporobacter balticus TaxID=2018667 RepID=A0A4R2KJ23_9FIRM|nr:nucleotidyltransferase family protein [Marinisporobacter balticus]TCO73643.1 CBS domain protein [Marinisporobacter balticus]
MNMNIIKNLCIRPDVDIGHAMKVMDEEGKAIALVIDGDDRLIGIITDSEVRRAILNGVSLDCLVKSIMNTNFIFITKNYTQTLVRNIFEQKRIKQLPVLDDHMKVMDLIMYHEINNKPSKENYAVIMAGGLGTRLRPLTNEIPKPMLKLGAKPILETIIEQLKSYGYTNIVLCLNYKGYMIENYFQDGSSLGVNIKYVKEEKRLGTAGAIRLAEKYLDKSFFVVNGDILTKLNFEQFLNYHQKHENLITIGTRKYEIQVPYGVIELKEKEETVTGLLEKPSLDVFISGGMYCLEPETLECIPKDAYCDITDLINVSLNKKRKIGSFLITEYWMDIGQMQDYDQAKLDYTNLFLKHKIMQKNQSQQAPK